MRLQNAMQTFIKMTNNTFQTDVTYFKRKKNKIIYQVIMIHLLNANYVVIYSVFYFIFPLF